MIVDEVRGIAFMKGLKMLVNNNEFIKKLMDHKMLTVKAEENVIRLFPSLLSSTNELQEGLDKIEKVAKK
jgi:acetylornithine/succinyldiaminopimelate/putrescine aminotransferase